MSTPPLLSIITSTYNALPLFEETAEGVARLDLDYEWIIGDNASTDGTVAYIERLASRDPRVRCRLNPVNLGGPLPNLRRLIPEATGKYVLCLDGDDTLPSTAALAAQLDVLERQPDIHVAISKVEYMDRHSRVYMVKAIPFAPYGSSMSGRRMFWTLFLSPTYPLKWGAVLVRKSFFEVTGLIFDIDFMMEAARHTRFAMVDAVGLRYRNHAASNTSRHVHLEGERWWTNLAHSYLPNETYLGLKYPIIAYKWILGQMKSAYRVFSPKRI